MDSDDADHGIQTEDQFWDGMESSACLIAEQTDGRLAALDETISQECATHSHIDDALRSYLGLVAGSKGGNAILTSGPNADSACNRAVR